MTENVSSVEKSVVNSFNKYEKLSKWLNHNMKVKITDGIRSYRLCLKFDY